MARLAPGVARTIADISMCAGLCARSSDTLDRDQPARRSQVGTMAGKRAARGSKLLLYAPGLCTANSGSFAFWLQYPAIRIRLQAGSGGLDCRQSIASRPSLRP